MGYRSDGKIVFYALNPGNHAAIKLWVDENFPKKDFAYEEPIIDGRTIMAFSFGGWKWYDSYSEIQAINEALNSFCSLFDREEAVVRGAMEFVRLGEETDDVEMRQSNHAEYILTVNRSIDFS